MFNLLILIVDTGILEVEFVGKIFFAAFICIDGFLSGVLAKNLKVSKQFLSDVEHNRKEVGISFAKKVSDALEYSIYPLIELLIRDQLRKNHLDYIVELKKAS